MASPTPEDIALCIRVLDGLVEDRAALADLAEDTRRTLLTLAGRLSRPTRAEQRDLAKAFRRKDRLDVRSQDEAVLEATGVRSLRRESVFPTPLLPSVAPALSETNLPTPADDPRFAQLLGDHQTLRSDPALALALTLATVLAPLLLGWLLRGRRRPEPTEATAQPR